jgi:predicted nucleic acid-binding Zn ribbon protein
MLSLCPICGRINVKTIKVDNYVYACAECGSHFSALNNLSIDDNATHCCYCHALIDKRLQIDGLGVQCGCASMVFKELKLIVVKLGYKLSYKR